MVDAAGKFCRYPAADRPVGFLNTALKEQLMQFAQGLGVASQDQAAGCVAIKAMGERWWPRQAVTKGVEIILQAFPAFAFSRPGARMDGQPGRFVDDQHQSVAIDHAIQKEIIVNPAICHAVCPRINHITTKSAGLIMRFQFVTPLVLRLGLALSIWLGAGLQERTIAAEETPDYRVIERADPIEIRDYPPMLLASVTVTGSRQEASSKAFRILASFIFGENESRAKVAMTAPVTQQRSEKIAMTAPVTQELSGPDEWVVDFMMPSEYSLETLPKPKDPRIGIRLTKPYRAAAIRFSGRYTDANIGKHREALERYLEENNIETVGSPRIAYYNSPFTPVFLRRNEVIYQLAEHGSE